MKALNYSKEYFESIPAYQKSYLTLERQLDCAVAANSLQFDILTEKTRIGYMEADLRVLLEDGSYDMLDTLYTEEAQKSGNKLVDAVVNIFNSIVKFFKDLIDNIRKKVASVFGKSKANEFTAEDWEKSGIKDMYCNVNYNKKLTEIEAKMTEGERLIQMASGATGIPAAKIDGYVQSSKDLIHNLPKLSLKVAAGVGVGAGVVLLAKNYRNIVGGLLDRGEKCMQVADKAKDKIEKFKDDKTGLTAQIEYEKRVAQTMAELSKAEGSWINRLALGVTSFVDNALGRDDAATPKSVKAAAMSAGMVGRKPNRSEKKVIKQFNREKKYSEKTDRLNQSS